MVDEHILEELSRLIPQKKSKAAYARILGITEQEVEEGLIELRVKDDDKAKADIMHLSGVWNYPPKPEDIIKTHRIDTKKWKLSQLWVKQGKQGTFTTSADFVPLKSNELNEETIKEVLSKVINDSTVKPMRFNKKKRTNNKALFVYTSDKHVGAQTKSESPYDNHYDEKVFENRMGILLEEILNLCNTFGTFEDIYIIDLGDPLDGYDSHTCRKDHRLPQNMDNKRAFMSYLETHKKFFDAIVRLEVAKGYHFIACSEDNHSGSFGFMANQAVVTYLNAKYPEMETRVMEKFIEHFEYGDHTFVLCHGKDSEDMKVHLPLNLNDRAEAYIGKYLDYYNIHSKKVHFVKGDLHQDASQTTYRFRYKNVLSMYGASKYIHNNFGPNVAGVSMDIVDKNGPGIFEYKIEY
jgi:hypothetical protein